jgi:hypothetical protein
MRIRDVMASRFGKDSVFIDIDSIPLGVDFPEYINSQLSACEALIAIIGPHWIEAGRGPGQGVHLKTDFVRIEVEAALKRKILPALVAGARAMAKAVPTDVVRAIVSDHYNRAAPTPPAPKSLVDSFIEKFGPKAD